MPWKNRPRQANSSTPNFTNRTTNCSPRWLLETVVRITYHKSCSCSRRPKNSHLPFSVFSALCKTNTSSAKCQALTITTMIMEKKGRPWDSQLKEHLYTKMVASNKLLWWAKKFRPMRTLLCHPFYAKLPWIICRKSLIHLLMDKLPSKEQNFRKIKSNGIVDAIKLTQVSQLTYGSRRRRMMVKIKSFSSISSTY